MVLLDNRTLSNTLTLDDLEISPRSQGTAGARPPSTTTHHVPSPSSLPRSPCSPATGATGRSKQSTQQPVPLGSGPCPGVPCPHRTHPLVCGPEPEPPLPAMYFPLSVLPITFAQMGVNTGTLRGKGRWLAFCFGWGWVRKVGPEVAHIPGSALWTQGGAWSRALPRFAACLLS